jgi:hypothetical protein
VRVCVCVCVLDNLMLRQRPVQSLTD